MSLGRRTRFDSPAVASPSILDVVPTWKMGGAPPVIVDSLAVIYVHSGCCKSSEHPTHGCQHPETLWIYFIFVPADGAVSDFFVWPGLLRF